MRECPTFGDPHGSCSAHRGSPSHDEGLENTSEPSLAAGQAACGCHLLGDRAGSPRGGACRHKVFSVPEPHEYCTGLGITFVLVTQLLNIRVYTVVRGLFTLKICCLFHRVISCKKQEKFCSLKSKLYFHLSLVPVRFGQNWGLCSQPGPTQVAEATFPLPYPR